MQQINGGSDQVLRKQMLTPTTIGFGHAADVELPSSSVVGSEFGHEV